MTFQTSSGLFFPPLSFQIDFLFHPQLKQVPSFPISVFILLVYCYFPLQSSPCHSLISLSLFLQVCEIIYSHLKIYTQKPHIREHKTFVFLSLGFLLFQLFPFACKFNFFLLLNSIPLCISTMFFINYSFVRGHSDCSHFLAIVNRTAMKMPE